MELSLKLRAAQRLFARFFCLLVIGGPALSPMSAHACFISPKTVAATRNAATIVVAAETEIKTRELNDALWRADVTLSITRILKSPAGMSLPAVIEERVTIDRNDEDCTRWIPDEGLHEYSIEVRDGKFHVITAF